MALISIFLRPILALDAHVTVEPVAATVFRDVVVSRPVWGLGGARGGEERTMTRQAALVSETPVAPELAMGESLFQWRRGRRRELSAAES